MTEAIQKQNSFSNNPTHERIYDAITALIAPLGYEVVHFEIHTHRQKVLRVFIDHLDPSAAARTSREPSRPAGVTLEDCATVSRALDEPLDQLPELDAIFHGVSYELEVSSPGVDRPLRHAKDFNRFSGREVRIHTFRPLTADELGNLPYQAKNPKQKNFLGKLLGFTDGKVRLGLPTDGSDAKKGKKKKAAKGAEVPQTAVQEISIPYTLISKANIEPKFDELSSSDDSQAVVLDGFDPR